MNAQLCSLGQSKHSLGSKNHFSNPKVITRKAQRWLKSVEDLETTHSNKVLLFDSCIGCHPCWRERRLVSGQQTRYAIPGQLEGCGVFQPRCFLTPAHFELVDANKLPRGGPRAKKEDRVSARRKPCLGRGCGAVSRAVASNTRDLRFESRHRQYFECIYLSIAIQKRRK